jgi:hypothetical protein
MFANKKSEYVCVVDGSHRVTHSAGRKIICPTCKVEMKEINKGIITKSKWKK